MTKRTTNHKSPITLSVIIIAKNEEEKLPDCLKSVAWADEIILIDSGSTDKTKEIAKKRGARIIDYSKGSFSDWRNAGLKAAKGKWVFYIDADERATDKVEKELREKIENTENGIGAFAIPRRNFILGKEMKHGDQWPDYQMRFFKKDKLKGYKNDLHEVAAFKGVQGYLQAPLIHLKHDNLSDMITKTNRWSVIEAELLLESDHPRMVPWRFIRIMLTEAWIRLFKQKGVLDGAEGIIYSIYQVWSKFITYGKLWEMQIAEGESKVTSNK